MKTQMIGVLAFGAVSALGSVTVPSISNVTVELSLSSRLVKVTYDLQDVEGIVTCDFLTNGVSIGQANIAPALVGDVNKEVAVGTGKTIYWRPYKSWIDGKLLKGATVTAQVTAWAKDNPPDYMVVDLAADSTITYYMGAEAIPDGVSNNVYKTSKMVFRKIPAANRSFVMGSAASEAGRQTGLTGYDNYYLGEETAHVVSFTNDFYLAIYELTQAQYRTLMANIRGHFTEADDSDIRPVDTLGRFYLTGQFSGPDSSVDRYAVVNNYLVQKFRAKSGLSKTTLPTEAEWEFAARAGVSSAYFWGGEMTTNAAGAYVSSELGDYAWYAENSNGETHPVGLKKPNAWGLYDMYGNVAETTLDRAKLTGYRTGTLKYPTESMDPVWSRDLTGADDGGAGNGANVVRGGSWLEPAASCRSAARCAPLATWGFNNVPTSGWNMGARLAVRLF